MTGCVWSIVLTNWLVTRVMMLRKNVTEQQPLSTFPREYESPLSDRSNECQRPWPPTAEQAEQQRRHAARLEFARGRGRLAMPCWETAMVVWLDEEWLKLTDVWIHAIHIYSRASAHDQNELLANMHAMLQCWRLHALSLNCKCIGTILKVFDPNLKPICEVQHENKYYHC